VQAIAVEAKKLADEPDGIDEEWEAHRKQIEAKIAGLRKFVSIKVATVEAGLRSVLNTPTQAVWTQDLHDAIRGLGMQVSNQPDVKAKYRPRTNVYSSAPFVTNQRYTNPQAEWTNILRKYRLVMNLLDEIKADL
jgi:hypothetical protein